MSIAHGVFCLNIYRLFFLANFAAFQDPASKDANKSKSLEIQAWGLELSFVPGDIKQLFFFHSVSLGKVSSFVE